MRSEEFAALPQGLFMGYDLADGGGGIVLAHEMMLHAQLLGADNVEIVLFHEVVYLGDGTCGAVFDGQDAVTAHALFYGAEYIVKALKVQDVGIGEQLFAGLLGIGALGALAGHQRAVGQALALSLGNGLFDLGGKGGRAVIEGRLIAAAEVEHLVVQGAHIGRVGVACSCGDAVDDAALTGMVADGGGGLLLAGGNLGYGVHALDKKAHHLVVNAVDRFTNIGKIHQ